NILLIQGLSSCLTFYLLLNTLLIDLTTLSKSSSVIFESDGKHRPFSNSFSATSKPTYSYFSKNGCRCFGFHSGRDSIFSFSNASIISTGFTAPSTVIAVNQKFGSSHSFCGIIVMSLILLNDSL